MKNIGIIGRKRSGKDTAARFLVEQGYARHGLADPLKTAALALDPIVHTTAGPDGSGIVFNYRLSEIVAIDGWEHAKDEYPEVRRILQRLGDEAGRQVHGEFIWVDHLLERVNKENHEGRPVVVPDVRYPNEAADLADEGFLLIRIVRPGFDQPAEGEHASEQVEQASAHVQIINDGTLLSLQAAVLNAAGVPLSA